MSAICLHSKNETFLVIFTHCELSYSMLHFCQIAILLHISILKNVFSPFSHPNSSWTRMPVNRWCPSLLLFPPTVRERLILNSLRTLSGFLKDWTDIATHYSLYRIRKSLTLKPKGEEFLKDDHCFCSVSHILGIHSVWKLPKKSHSTLRAERATFTFWVDKSS